MGSRWRRSINCVVLVLVLGVSCNVAVSDATGRSGGENQGGKSFCARPTIHDYNRALKRLPPIEGLPSSGTLPFGPAGLKVAALGRDQQLLFVGSSARYQFTNLGMPDSRLGWTVKIGLSRIAQDGSTWQIAPESVFEVDELGPRGTIRVIEAPKVPGRGSYRIDLVFLDESGKLLGGYAEYAQVVPSTFKARLGVSGERVASGGVLRARIENVGTRGVGYGYEFELARFSKGVWIGLPGQPFFSSRTEVTAGMAGRCEMIRIPRHAPPGLYRISKEVEPSGDSRKRVTLNATFRVVG